MAWATPLYSRTRVDVAGFTYINGDASREEREVARAVINNWRTSHHYPLNTFQVNLRRHTRRFDDDPTVAQRIKRLASIRDKLERFDGMKLSRMQDIGGCRAVLTSVETVDDLVGYYKGVSRMKHKLIRDDDYIREPKASGYRGVHLIYSYNSDRSTTWNGLKIELQIRSRLQHAWATAVETVGTFTQQALKSSQGSDDWLDFFARMSSALALREGTQLVPGTPDDPDALRQELRGDVARLDVANRLRAYGGALRLVGDFLGELRGHTYVLELDVANSTLSATPYTDRAVAAEAYTAIERAIEGQLGKDVVMVAVDDMASLRRAYPNYFGDTAIFLEAVEQAVA